MKTTIFVLLTLSLIASLIRVISHAWASLFNRKGIEKLQEDGIIKAGYWKYVLFGIEHYIVFFGELLAIIYVSNH